MKTIFALVAALALAVPGHGGEPASPAREAFGEEAPIVLPDFQVTATHSWQFAEIPGCQILSLESPKVTAEFAKYLDEHQEFFARLAPEIRRPNSYTSNVAVLGGSYLSRFRETGGGFRQADWGALDAGGDRSIRFFTDPKERGQTRPAHVRWASLFSLGIRTRLLESHRELPEWYREGIGNCGIYFYPEQTTSGRRLIVSISITRDTLRTLGLTKARTGEAEAQPDFWPLARLFSTTRPNASVRSLIRLTPAAKNLYRDQCALFLHWGLTGGGKEQREGFRKFVAAASEQTADETLFQRCFGFGMAEGERRFRKFAFDETKRELDRANARLRPDSPSARDADFVADEIQQNPREADQKKALAPEDRDRFSLRLNESSYDFLLPDSQRKGDPRRIESRSATQSEALRILGEAYLWAAFYRADSLQRSLAVSPFDPESRYRPVLDHAAALYDRPKSEDAMRFVEKARKILFPLTKAEGPSDPELIALTGFLDLRLGNRAEAESLLQRAVPAALARPAAYLELARLQLDAAVRAPTGANGHPGREQVEPAREWLRQAVRKCPELESAYQLLAYAWGCSGETPTDEDLTLLIRSVRWFPEGLMEAREIANLCERAGKRREAAAVARIGLAWVAPRAPAKLVAELRRLAALPDGQRESPASRP